MPPVSVQGLCSSGAFNHTHLTGFRVILAQKLYGPFVPVFASQKMRFYMRIALSLRVMDFLYAKMALPGAVQASLVVVTVTGSVASGIDPTAVFVPAARTKASRIRS
jgi:hypothetical protein